MGSLLALVVLPGCGDDEPMRPSTPKPYRLAFTSRPGGLPQVYVVNPDGTGLLQISATSDYATDPSWTPSGSSISFSNTDYDSLESDIYIVSPDGSGQVNLTASPGAFDVEARWSPDGRQVAFVTYVGGNFDIYSMDANGSSLRRLTNESSEETKPEWSPLGDLAFLSTRDGNREIYVMKPDGSMQQRITNTPSDEWTFAWSPDGSRIAFPSDRSGNVDVYVVTADGASEQRITTDSSATDPCWSPDGSRIAYTSSDGIHIVNSDGSHDMKVPGPFSAHFPIWSPDGRFIAYVDLGASSQDLYVMKVDGSDNRNLSSGIGAELEPPVWER